jgi:hypothetical protein
MQAKLMPFGIRDYRRRSIAILNKSTTCSMQGWKIFEDTSKFGQIRETLPLFFVRPVVARSS